MACDPRDNFDVEWIKNMWDNFNNPDIVKFADDFDEDGESGFLDFVFSEVDYAMDYAENDEVKEEIRRKCVERNYVFDAAKFVEECRTKEDFSQYDPNKWQRSFADLMVEQFADVFSIEDMKEGNYSSVEAKIRDYCKQKGY